MEDGQPGFVLVYCEVKPDQWFLNSDFLFFVLLSKNQRTPRTMPLPYVLPILATFLQTVQYLMQERLRKDSVFSIFQSDQNLKPTAKFLPL